MKDREAWHAAVHVVAESWTHLLTEQQNLGEHTDVAICTSNMAVKAAI